MEKHCSNSFHNSKFKSMKKQSYPQLYRQKFLLAMLKRFNGTLNITDFMKYVFLTEYEEANNKKFSFVPYKYGPFSFQVYADLRRLEQLSFIKFDETLSLVDNNTNYISLLNDNDQDAINTTFNKYFKLKGQVLLEDVCNRYPYFTIKSEIVNAKKKSIAINSNNSTPSIFTVGYEGKSIDFYLNQLIENNIHLVIDVRKNPISMKYGFSKNFLSKTLPELDIEYIHLPQLGIETQKRKNLNSINDYKRLFKEYEISILNNCRTSIDTIVQLYRVKTRIALTCFENDVKLCHRSVIARVIESNYGITVFHI